jgi:hypothetical protein
MFPPSVDIRSLPVLAALSVRSRRVLLVTAIGLAAAVYADQFFAHPRTGIMASDFGQVWFGSRTLLAGSNPYDVVGPGRAFDWPFPLLYPVTALLAATPLAWLPLRLAETIFVGLGAGLLAWGLTRRTIANPQLLVFASFSMMAAAQCVQWSPLLTAAALIPTLGFVFAAKPTIGLALCLAYPSRRALIGCIAIAVLSFVVWPSWPWHWIATLPSASHITAPIMRPGGFLLALALLRWRRPEARLLFALGCVPQTPTLNETVPLFLVVQTLPEGLTLMSLTIVAAHIVGAVYQGTADYQGWMAGVGIAGLWLVYLPCLIMVLRRPNVGVQPVWRSSVYLSRVVQT